MLSKFMNKAKAIVQDLSGATAIEYGLIAAGIAIVIITAVLLIGTSLSASFNSVANALNN